MLFRDLFDFWSWKQMLFEETDYYLSFTDFAMKNSPRQSWISEKLCFKFF